ncbi:MAG TPA: hypothetical protein VNJ09_00375 [Chthonomonadales bacterium]|nr:hypothetical protein [Chthonomonadales bacterium]
MDSDRNVTVAEQDSANAAVSPARSRRVAAFVLISGRLGQFAKEIIARSPRRPFAWSTKGTNVASGI